jgi:sulfite exporter TauE/SafE
MSSKSSYTVLGWVVWQIGSRLAKRKAAQNKGKLGAGLAVALVVAGGILVAAGDSDD